MYNVAPYVERCIRSLEYQSLSKDQYEIICVNDGSPDNCSEVIEWLQKEFPNIVLIDQLNQGVSMARNNAIALAKGDYILAIDPDDYVATDCLTKAMDYCFTNDLDTLYCSMQVLDVQNNPTWRTNYKHLVNVFTNGYESYFAVRGPNFPDPDRSVGIFFKRKLFANFKVKYPKQVPFLEDALFLGEILAVSNKVAYLDIDFYIRTTRPGSAMNSDLNVSDTAINGYILALEEVFKFENEYSFKGDALKMINQTKAKFLMVLVIALKRRGNKSEYDQILKSLKSKGLYYFSLSGVATSYKRLVLALRISKDIFWYFQKHIYILNRINEMKIVDVFAIIRRRVLV
jgi:glycosyltransferase involved in cell wall biosynthesis